MAHVEPNLDVRERIPRLELPLLSGGTLDLGAQPGHPMVIKFWAGYCGACGREAKAFSRERERLPRASRLTVVGVSLDTDRAVALRAAREWGFSADRTVFYGAGFNDDPAKRAFGVRSIPETFWVDHTGRVRAHGRHLELVRLLAALGQP